MAKVTMKSAVLLGERTEEPRTKDGKPWKHDAFEVTLECDGREFITPWKQGVANRADKRGKMIPVTGKNVGMFYDEMTRDWRPGTPVPPTAAAVLESLLMDSGAMRDTFEDWCAEFGENTDSISALKLYLSCQETGKRLRKFLGMTADEAVEKFGNGSVEDAAKALAS